MKQLLKALLLCILPSTSALITRKWGQTSGVALNAAKNNSSALNAHHVVYTADAKVFDALLRSMQSLSIHLSAPERCRIHIIVPQADREQAARLVQCFRQRLQAKPSRLQKLVP